MNLAKWICLAALANVVFSNHGFAVDPRFKAYPNIEYENIGGEGITLNLYRDPNIQWRVPLVIFIHGGGWTGRTKADGEAYADAFLKRGYAFAAIDYRLAPGAIFPAQIQDAKAAVRFLRAHAADYNIDPDKIGVMGHSAGGHLASLLGTTNDDPQFDIGDNLNVSGAVQAVCDMSGPSDFLMPAPSLQPLYAKLLGGPVNERQDLAKLASPITHVSAKSAPFLILHGDKDAGVPKEESQELAAALEKAGVPVQLIFLPGQPHNLNLWAHTGTGNYLEIVLKFFDLNLKKQK
jgi:acetyl esterase/lipase